MAKTKRELSEAERAERRARDRERLQHAARELLTSDGWQRWVRARALFHNYSLRNCLLLAAQCHERGIDARRVAGFRTWLKLGRCVRKGEKGLVVLAPMPIKRREDSEERARRGSCSGRRSCSPTRRPTRCLASVSELVPVDPFPDPEGLGVVGLQNRRDDVRRGHLRVGVSSCGAT